MRPMCRGHCRTDVRRHRVLAGAGWVVTGGLTLAAVLRTAAPESSRWLVLLAALTPLLYLPAWLVVIGAGVGRRWRLLVVASVLVGLHVWWSAPLVLGGRGEMSHATSSARVLALNLNADRATGAATARLIRELRPDVVVLSEASSVSVAGLGDQLLPVAASDVRPGTDGWMVLSRWPVVDQSVFAVEARTKPRLVLQRPDGGRLVVWQVHPVAPVVGHVTRWRHQLELVRRAVAADRHAASPVVVAGDFNATRDLPS